MGDSLWSRGGSGGPGDDGRINAPGGSWTGFLNSWCSEIINLLGFKTRGADEHVSEQEEASAVHLSPSDDDRQASNHEQLLQNPPADARPAQSPTPSSSKLDISLPTPPRTEFQPRKLTFDAPAQPQLSDGETLPDAGPTVVEDQREQQTHRPDLPFGAYLPTTSSRPVTAKSKADEERRKKLTEAIRRRKQYEKRFGALRATPANTQNQVHSTPSRAATPSTTTGQYSALRLNTFSGSSRVSKYQSPFKKITPAGTAGAPKPSSLSSMHRLHNDVYLTAVRNRLAPNLYGGLPSSPLAESLSPARSTPEVRRRPIPFGISDSKSVDELLKRLVKEGNATDFPSFQALQERRKARLKAIEELRRPKKEIITPLNSAQLSKVQQCLSSGNLGQTLISAFRIDITVRDVKTLGDRQWLNDNVIDFYLELVTQRSRDHASKNDDYPRSFVYTTHFYSTLQSKGYQGVARWGRRKQLDLASVDYIFIPINIHNAHWCASVINIKDKRFEYYDSMAGGPGGAFKYLREYLINESRTQNVPLNDVDQWEDYIPNDSPLQRNGYDCGVFTCKTVEVLSRAAPLTFTQNEMKLLRQRMVFEILQGKLLNA